MNGGRLRVFVLVSMAFMYPAAPSAGERPIVAVFRIQDKGADLNAGRLDSLSDYLAAAVAEGGVFRVVPPADIRRLLTEKKKESYKRCYDRTCQIELGRELSANKSLSASILRFGKSCTVMVSLYDLKTQTTDVSAKAKGSCAEGGLTDSIDSATARIRAWASGERGFQEGVIGEKPAGWKVGDGQEVIVHFESKPEGAVVILDGKLLCARTPCSKAVPPGAHLVSMQAKRSLARKERVVLASRGRVNFKLDPNFGWLTVRSRPAGQRVSMDGKVIGKTPVEKLKVEPGGHEVLVASPCHYNAGERVRIGRGRERTVKVELKEKQGAVRVAARDAKGNDVAADVFIDGVKIGTAPGVFKVCICSRELVARHPALGTGRKILEVRENQKHDVQVALSEEDSPMVLVPAGKFTRGSPDDRGDYDEHPRHVLYLDAFWIDKLEVTVRHFVGCVDADTCKPPGTGAGCNWNAPGREDHPVNCVNWHQAEAYCRWAGKRLCTEAQWEKAARGTDGRNYPWGSRQPQCGKHAVCKTSTTMPAGSKPAGASPYQALDMAGNVWEWVADWYHRDYYPESKQSNPPGPKKGSRRVNRGGGFADRPAHLRCADRWWADPSFQGESLGLRCCR